VAGETPQGAGKAAPKAAAPATPPWPRTSRSCRSRARGGGAGRGRRPDARMTRPFGECCASTASRRPDRRNGHSGRITREDVTTFVERQRGREGRTAAAQAAALPSVHTAPVLGVPSHAPGLAPSGPSARPFRPRRQRSGSRTGRSARRAQPDASRHRRPDDPSRGRPGRHSTFEADMTAVVNLRNSLGEAYKTREGVGLKLPAVRRQGRRGGVDGNPDSTPPTPRTACFGSAASRRIAIAVENGLIVPVITNADQLSISGSTGTIRIWPPGPRTNKLRPQDLQGGTSRSTTRLVRLDPTVPIINTRGLHPHNRGGRKRRLRDSRRRRHSPSAR